jgi:hypothetical protein
VKIEVKVFQVFDTVEVTAFTTAEVAFPTTDTAEAGSGATA